MIKQDKRLLIILLIVIIVYIIGVTLHKYLWKESVMDSVYDTSLIMSGVSSGINPQTLGQKIFLSVYFLLSVGIYAILTAAIVERFLELDRQPC